MADSLKIWGQDEEVWVGLNYARHAPSNAGNAANIDKHHRQGIFLGVPPLERGEGKIIGIIYFQVKYFLSSENMMELQVLLKSC